MLNIRLCAERKLEIHQQLCTKKYLMKVVQYTSKVDNCNSLLYGLPDNHIAKLQRVQNASARLIVGLPRYCHITPVLHSLHWLPVRYRINFKFLLLTYNCLHGLAPQYMSDLLSIVPFMHSHEDKWGMASRET